MPTVEKFLRDELKKLPNKLLEKIIAGKLRKAGAPNPDVIAPKLLEHSLSGSTDKFVWDDGNPDSTGDFSIEINDDDLAELKQKSADFLKNDLPKVLGEVANGTAKDVLATLKKTWPEHAEWEDATFTAFRYNLDARWGKALDLLRMLLTMSREMGEERLKRYRRRKIYKEPRLWEVLFRLHARACQVSDEIITLMENGFADGAMARWRTLYEIGVVAIILREHGEPLAVRYVDHEVVEAKSAMDEYERTQVPLGFAPYATREKNKILKGYDEAVATHGKGFGSSYGWAAHHLKRTKPTFADLEAAAGRAEMRSYYKMASYNVHASPKGIFFRLGTFDSRKLIIAGASNAGLSEPGQNTAHTLALITMQLLGPRFAFQDIVSMKAMVLLRNEIAAAFFRAERKLRRDDAKHRKAGVTRRHGN